MKANPNTIILYHMYTLGLAKSVVSNSIFAGTLQVYHKPVGY